MTETVDDFVDEVERHRAELRVYCFRVVGSYDEAEDLVRETVLRAWRSQIQFEGRSTLRAWLYRIATNTSLDLLRGNQRRPRTYNRVPGMTHGDGPTPDRVEWLQAFPDALLDDVPAERSVFLVRDVLGWSAAETAQVLDRTVASVNSALQRAKPTPRKHLPQVRTRWASAVRTAEEQRVPDAYLAGRRPDRRHDCRSAGRWTCSGSRARRLSTSRRSIGTAIARRYVEEGARAHLAGRTEQTLAKVAAGVGATGYDVVDVRDEESVTAYLDRVVHESGRLDVSFNLASRGDVQVVPLIDMPASDFLSRSCGGSLGTSTPPGLRPGRWPSRARVSSSRSTAARTWRAQ